MTDNRIRIGFDYKKPDEATLITYEVCKGTTCLKDEPFTSIIKTYTGLKAIQLYSELSGMTIKEIEKEAEN